MTSITNNQVINASLTSGSGTQTIEIIERDYNNLLNKPTIGGVELVGDVLLQDALEAGVLTNMEIQNLIDNIG